MRGLLFLGIVLLVFLPFNWVTVRQLLRFHPRWKRWIVALAVTGNLMWPFFLTFRNFTHFSRISRAVLGPRWFAWTSLSLLYTAFVILLLLAWLPFRARTTFAEFGRRPSAALLLVLALGAVVGFFQTIVPLRVETVRVPIAGLPPSSAGTRLALLGDLHVGVFTRKSRLEEIFMTTSALHPDAVLIGLTMCAHTHGGQLGFRPLGWSLAGVFLKYHMDLYHVHGSRLYINTGTGYWLVPFRLGMTPEVTLIELVSG